MQQLQGVMTLESRNHPLMTPCWSLFKHIYICDNELLQNFNSHFNFQLWYLWRCVFAIQLKMISFCSWHVTFGGYKHCCCHHCRVLILFVSPFPPRPIYDKNTLHNYSMHMHNIIQLSGQVKWGLKHFM